MAKTKTTINRCKDCLTELGEDDDEYCNDCFLNHLSENEGEE